MRIRGSAPGAHHEVSRERLYASGRDLCGQVERQLELLKRGVGTTLTLSLFLLVDPERSLIAQHGQWYGNQIGVCGQSSTPQANEQTLSSNSTRAQATRSLKDESHKSQSHPHQCSLLIFIHDNSLPQIRWFQDGVPLAIYRPPHSRPFMVGHSAHHSHATTPT